MMKEVERGLFEVKDCMPCSPRHVKVSRYRLPFSLGEPGLNEAAARFLYPSKQRGQWVGVTWSRFADTIKEDCRIYKSIKDAQTANLDEEWRVFCALCWFYVLCVVTFGIYAYFATKPVARILKVPDDEIALSEIYRHGSPCVIDGVKELVSLGLLWHVRQGEGRDAFDIFFPTPGLVLRVMDQNVVAAS